jgi:hypothetical protein
MAPLIAALLGKLAENGLSLIGNAVMAKGKEVVEEKLGVKLTENSFTPEQLVVLKRAELEHEQWLLEAGRKETEMYLRDMQDARAMQIAALGQEDVFAKRFVYYFAMAWSFATVVYVGAITFGNIPQQNIRFADTILGFMLGTLITTIVQYFYGSSKQSRAKDDVLAEVVKNVTSK